MRRTGHFAVDSLPQGTAIGYKRGAQNAPPSAPLRPNTELLPGRGSSAGGGYDLVVLANLDPPATERIARLVRGWSGASD